MHLTAPRVGIALLTTVIVASTCNSSGSGSESTVAPVTTTPGSADPTDAGTNTEADVAGVFDIGGGRKMYLECRGEGSPTVVLLTGYRDTARIWDADLPGYPQPHLFPAVAGFARVCAYDRPGTVGPYSDDPAQYSRSDPVPQPHAPDDVVADLHALLAVADVPGPYVLAGHSLGGTYARLYAATYPDAVAGVVLIDAFNEYYRAAFTPEQWAPLLAFMGTPPPGLDDPDVERADLDAVLDAVEASGGRPAPARAAAGGPHARRRAGTAARTDRRPATRAPRSTGGRRAAESGAAGGTGAGRPPRDRRRVGSLHPVGAAGAGDRGDPPGGQGRTSPEHLVRPRLLLRPLAVPGHDVGVGPPAQQTEGCS